MGNKFKYRPQDKMDQQALFESRKREALSSLEKLNQAGDIKEAAVVFSQEGMKLFAEIFGNTMERKIEQAVDNKLKDVMGGFFEGMVNSYLEQIKPKIGLPAPEEEPKQEDEEPFQNEPLSVKIERETGITFNNEDIGKIDLSQDEEELPEDEEEEEQELKIYGWTKELDDELMEKIKIAQYKGDKLQRVYEELGAKWGKQPSAISHRKHVIQKGEVTYSPPKPRKAKVKSSKAPKTRKEWTHDEEVELLAVMQQGHREKEAGNRGVLSKLIKEFAEKSGRTEQGVARKGEKLLKFGLTPVDQLKERSGTTWNPEMEQELLDAVLELKEKGESRKEAIKAFAEKYDKTEIAVDRRYYLLAKDSQEQEEKPEEEKPEEAPETFPSGWTKAQDEELMEKVRHAKRTGRKVKKVFGELAPKYRRSRSEVSKRLDQLQKELGFEIK